MDVQIKSLLIMNIQYVRVYLSLIIHYYCGGLGLDRKLNFKYIHVPLSLFLQTVLLKRTVDILYLVIAKRQFCIFVKICVWQIPKTGFTNSQPLYYLSTKGKGR